MYMYVCTHCHICTCTTIDKLLSTCNSLDWSLSHQTAHRFIAPVKCEVTHSCQGYRSSTCIEKSATNTDNWARVQLLYRLLMTALKNPLSCYLTLFAIYINFKAWSLVYVDCRLSIVDCRFVDKSHICRVLNIQVWKYVQVATCTCTII